MSMRSSTNTNMEVTYTRKGTWYVTAPCGLGVEFPGALPEGQVRQFCAQHQRRCCRTARLVIETASGYREIQMKGKTA